MRDIIIDLQKSDTWKIQLTIAINFISSIDSKKKRMMHSKGDNIKCMPYNDVNEVVNELFDSLCSRYQINLETLREEVILFLIQLYFCIINVIK